MSAKKRPLKIIEITRSVLKMGKGSKRGKGTKKAHQTRREGGQSQSGTAGGDGKCQSNHRNFGSSVNGP